MDLDIYLAKYPTVSREDLEKILVIVDFDKCFYPPEDTLDFHAKMLHDARETIKKMGRCALQPGPIIQLLSVSLQLKEYVTPFAVYGRLGVEFPDFMREGLQSHDFYKCDSINPQLLDTTGTLRLNGPNFFSDPDCSYIPLYKNNIDLALFDSAGNEFVHDKFCLEETESDNDYEQVNSKSISFEKGSLTMNYISIPFGVYCRLEIEFSNREKANKRDFLDVNGRVVIRYDNTYGNYNLEEIVLFERLVHEQQRVTFGKHMQFDRHWAAIPAYSSIIIDLDLSDFKTGRKIINDKMIFRAQADTLHGNTFVLDDLFVELTLTWFSPPPMGIQYQKFSHHEKEIITDEMNIDEEDESDDDHDDDEEEEDEDEDEDEDENEDENENEEEDEDENEEEGPSSNLYLTRVLHPHRSRPRSIPAIEIFSIFIGRQKSMTLPIYGSIEVLSHDTRCCSIFKRDEDGDLGLSGHMNCTLDVVDGPRAYKEYSLAMKVDIKDKEDLAIKGYVVWEGPALERPLWRDRQLCGFFQCENMLGYVAVHYSMFDSAVQANIKVSLSCKLGFAHVCPKVFGSLIVEYNCFDYSSRYNKEHYRIVLFRRMGYNSIQLNADSTLPLSRTVVVVPKYASLVINVDLDLYGQKLLCAREIEIGEGRITLDTNDYMLHIEVDWCEVKCDNLLSDRFTI